MSRDDATLHPIEALSAFLDGEVGDVERRDLEAHLEACAVCRAMLDDLKTLDRAVADEPIPPAPADLARRIVAALPQSETLQPARARRPFHRAPMPLAAAASLVVATLIWLAWPGGRPNRAPIPTPEPPASAIDELRPQAGGAAAPGPIRSPQERLEKEALPAAPGLGLADGPAVAPQPTAKRDRMPPPQPKQAAEIAKDELKANEASATAAREDDAGEFARQDAAARLAAAQASATAPAPAALTAPAAPRVEALRVTGESRAMSDVLTLAPGTTSADLPALRAEPYAVRLLPANAMQVESGAYACTVTLTPEDARLLAAQYAALQPARGAGLGAATPPAVAAPQPVAPPFVAPPAADKDLRASASKTAVSGKTGAIVDATPEGRALILLLVGERYRAALEERCGPLPR